MEQASKKVISFSLYGRNPLYTLGAVDNVRHARWVYPGWRCRFYVADDVPQSIITRLKNYDAEVIEMGRYIGHEAMGWRFLVALDPEVDISIVRDTDSRFSKYEQKMVNEWLASGKKFHVMLGTHATYPIQGGMWGVRGTVPEFREPLEKFIQSPASFKRYGDNKLLLHNLYPLTRGNACLHLAVPLIKSVKTLKFYNGEPTQPFNSFLGSRFYIRTGKPRRIFIALSIYKNIPLYELFLAQFIDLIENRNLSRLFNDRNLKVFHLKFKFYVADDIRPDLVERLRCLGQVILKPAKTIHKDNPQYWKLSILLEKNLGIAMLTGFWEFFFLAYVARQGFNLQPLLHSEQLTASRILFRRLAPLSVCGPDTPLASVDDLVAQRNPKTSYQEFVRSTLYPRIAAVNMTVILSANPVGVGVLKGWSAVLFPLRFYKAVNGSWIEKKLKKLLRR